MREVQSVNDETARLESVLKLFLSTSGRIRRLTFLWGIVATVFLLFLASFVIYFAMAEIVLSWSGITDLPVGYIVSTLLNLGFSWLIICLMSKRLHDIGWSGWFSAFQLIPIAVAGINYALTSTGGERLPFELTQAAQIIYLTLTLLALLILLVWPGTKGPNRYGPPPGEKAAADISVFE